ncbi:uncharacterized protein METZ01_LOCUS471658, partial [marine metagenome]
MIKEYIISDYVTVLSQIYITAPPSTPITCPVM